MNIFLEIIGKILDLKDVQNVELKKVEGSKIEVFEGGKYVGRYLFENSREQTNNELTHELSVALTKIQDRTIGFFRMHGHDKIEMVIERESWGGLRTICPNGMGGFSDTHIPESKGIYKAFGEGRTLSDMLKNPIELKFSEFCESFKK